MNLFRKLKEKGKRLFTSPPKQSNQSSPLNANTSNDELVDSTSEQLGAGKKPCTYCATCSKRQRAANCQKRGVKPAPAPKPVPTPTPAPSVTTNIPYSSLPGNMTILQCDTIMSLVSIPENSTTKWWDNYNYCEDIGDGRGMTVSLVGFCSGTSDLLWVFKDLQKLKPDHPLLKYLPVLAKVNGTDNTRGLESLAADLKKYGDSYWRQAVWDGILYFYWNTAINYAAKMGLKTAISKGFLYDLALNHGAEQMSVMGRRVKAPAPIAGGDEKTWLSELISVRQTIITKEDLSTNSGQPDRCIMWNSILKSGNVDLKRPIRNLVCYGEAFTIQ